MGAIAIGLDLLEDEPTLEACRHCLAEVTDEPPYCCPARQREQKLHAGERPAFTGDVRS